MLMEVIECGECGKSFSFESSKCGQIILKDGGGSPTIVFLAKCVHCGTINEVEMPWENYGVVDY